MAMAKPRRNSLLTHLDVNLIDVNPNPLRTIDDEVVARLATSMQKIGLMTPITVRLIEDDDGDRWVLVAGRHRLAAALSLGWERIDVFEVKWTDTEARLWEISENLDRAELTHLQRDEQLAEWIRLTETIPAQNAPKLGRPESGINAASRDLGVERTDAQRAVKVASLSPEAKAAAVEHGLDDNRTALLEAAKESDPEKQVASIVQRAVKPPLKPALPNAGSSSKAMVSVDYDDSADGGSDVASPEVLEDNMLHVLGGMNENARIFNKFFKISAFDRKAANRIVAAIDKTISKLKAIQSTLGQLALQRPHDDDDEDARTNGGTGDRAYDLLEKYQSKKGMNQDQKCARQFISNTLCATGCGDYSEGFTITDDVLEAVTIARDAYSQLRNELEARRAEYLINSAEH
jgi:ParB/RepB/Spo0J family partition protein